MLKALTRSLSLAGLLLLAAGPARADEKQNQQSIRAAIDYLKRNYANNETAGAPAGGVVGPQAAGAGVGANNQGGGHEEGPVALAGIALLEAGVSRDDPVIQQIAKTIRAAAIEQSKTYQISLDIIFLDKLGEQIDTMLIQSMAIRLLAGQNARFGWGYPVAALDEQDKARLRNALNNAVLKGSKDLPAVGADLNNRPKMDPDVEDSVKRLVRPKDQYGTDDNSNTQFAIIALWSARKHGVPVDDAFNKISQRFRSIQDPRTGGWSYTSAGVMTPTAPMTCAGLLGLAIVTGVRGERSMRSKGTVGRDGTIKIDPSKANDREIPNMLEDPAVKKGLAFLQWAISQNRAVGPGGGPMGGFGGGAGRGNFPPNGAPNGPGAGGGGPMAPPLPPAGGPMGPGVPFPPGGNQFDDMRSDLYFLWSMERVCVVFGLQKLGNIDWHKWGADYLLRTQNHDGSWRGKYGPSVDTSFGLMFMCKSNIIRDLSKMLDRSMKAGTAATDTKPSETKAGTGSKKSDDAVGAVETEAASLVQALLKAGAGKQAALIKEYSAEKGTKYTYALALSIPKLSGGAQSDARDALAERLARYSAKTLKQYLEQDNAELCRAAAYAAAMRDEKELIPDLIKMLDDTEEIIWRAAAVALRELSGKDFGPKKGATEAQRTKAISDWQAWYAKNKTNP